MERQKSLDSVRVIYLLGRVYPAESDVTAYISSTSQATLRLLAKQQVDAG